MKKVLFRGLIGLLFALYVASCSNANLGSVTDQGDSFGAERAVASKTSGVMMQGFYWDVPSGGTWWNTLKARASTLANMAGGYGIDVI